MASPRNRRHIFVPGAPRVEPYTPHPRAIQPSMSPAPASRAARGNALKQALQSAVAQQAQRRASARIEVHGATPGIYVEFESLPGVPLELKSLEAQRQGIELVTATHTETAEPHPRRIERAVVFVPLGQVKHFITRFERYAREAPKDKREQRHEKMLDPVASLRLATLRGLWTDAPDTYPRDDESIWWEVWLRRHDGNEVQRLAEFVALADLAMSSRRLQFDERIVTLVRATPRQLAISLDVLDDLAEVRKAKETVAVFEDMDAQEQAAWMQELRERITPPAVDAPAVCILDTGVNRGHPLLEMALPEDDCQACSPDWGNHDHLGHGTEMAGLALYGDLVGALSSTAPIQLRHRIESVKILPPRGRNEPDLYGAVTAEAVSRAEIQASTRRRCFSMAVTAPDEGERGEPTSWSAAVDALAAGRAFDPRSQGLVYLDDEHDPVRRLFVISAGNVAPEFLEVAYLNRNDTSLVEDPAQAWNALTVGAYTEKARIDGTSWVGWQPLATPGDLSPWSKTSVSFDDRWPIKPDVVFEGGNLARNEQGEISEIPDLDLLSTSHQPGKRPFVLTWGTSAATAQVARMAAIIAAEYPQLWPEAVRALLVHSARWTPAMHAHLRAAGTRKRARAELVRRYGFGVPSMERALRSANDSLTLIVQGSIRPFEGGRMREIHLHALPWPRDVLAQLGKTSVRLRVTLSYFVEPNPSRRGWKGRYHYASHGLRFEVKGAAESLDEFHKRINLRALDEDDEKPSRRGDSSEWYLGEHARSHGSLHADSWEGTAADLSDRGVLGVYPVSGWWKDQPRRDRSDKGVRYALIVSIEAEAAKIDIWTPVAAEVGVPIAIVP